MWRGGQNHRRQQSQSSRKKGEQSKEKKFPLRIHRDPEKSFFGVHAMIVVFPDDFGGVHAMISVLLVPFRVFSVRISARERF